LRGNNPFNLEQYLKERQQLVEAALADCLVPAPEAPALLLGAIRYSLFAGGKRIRPILCLASFEAIDESREFTEVLPVACALEMIHTYSLIHDDLPSMDNDDFRRGMPTSHRVFGEDMAILAGDALLAEAFALLSRENAPGGVDPSLRLRVVHLVARASGTGGLAGGQVLDLKASEKDMDLPLLEKMHGLKTGALIAASLQVGGLMAGGDERQLAALACYGRKVGLAFQIVDDLLNVEGEGDGARLGKSVGSDARQGKATYPAILGMDESRRLADKLTGEAVQALSIFGEKAIPLRELAYFIIARKY
jgi:geranylgeranyl diphosphate synthase type II